MNKIDISQWQKYCIDELFEAHLSKDDIQVKNTVSGEIPLVSSGKENNGIISYIYDDTAKLWNANTITVDMFGKAFYQDKPYHCVSHGRVNILEPIVHMSEYSMRFIALAIESVSLKKYEFNEMCTGTKLLKDEIYLPSKNNKPDWEYMDNYMKNIEFKVCDKILNLESFKNAKKNKINISKWKEFSLKSLGFSNSHGERIKKSDRIDGDIIFITAGKENCGVVGTIGNDIDIWHNPITVDMFGNCFYHDYDCSGDDNVYAFINDNLSALSKSFIASSINARNKNIFMYSDQFRQDNADTLSVLLPEKTVIQIGNILRHI